MKAIVKTAIAMFALVAVAAQAAAPNVTELRKEAERLEGVWNSMRSDTRLNELAPDEMARTAKIMEKVTDSPTVKVIDDNNDQNGKRGNI